MKKEFRELEITEIIIKSRLRKDLGELGTLTNSIRKYGLLCPVIVDMDNVLISGMRRLEACRQAGLTRIPVFKINAGYKSMQALDIQSDENLCRQPLTQEELERQIQLKKNLLKGGPFRIFSNFLSFLKGLFKGKK